MNRRYTLATSILSLFILLLSTSVGTAQDFWGLTANGGPEGNGTLFKTDTGGINLQVKYTFPCTSNPGGTPFGDLLQASDGKLYGLTFSDQANNMGVLFKYDPVTATYTKLVNFLGASNGANPYGSLIQATNGKLYGMTSAGGTASAGTIFEFDPTGLTLTKLHDFDGGANGNKPYGSLIQLANGKMYGMTYQGGANTYGIIFEFDPAGPTFTTKYSFDGAANGGNCVGSLVLASNKLYGMTFEGGSNSGGVIFSYDPVTATFAKKTDLPLGATPYGNLINGLNGKLYGMTYSDGSGLAGTIIQYDTVSSVAKSIYDFTGGATGSRPQGSLCTANNGKLYGMTNLGGTPGSGIIFEFDTVTKAFVKRFDFGGAFTAAVLGSSPNGSVIQATNGKLYGLTNNGGISNSGVLFEYDLTGPGIYADKVDFNIALNGASPTGSLVRAANGKFYGLTTVGGAHGIGVLFEYDSVSNTFTKKVDFDDVNNGFSPQGSLLLSSTGKLYGMTISGGSNGQGVLFDYNPNTSIMTKRLDFGGGGVAGQQPLGTLIEAANGELYGLTSLGGLFGSGAIFQYDTATVTYTNLYDFDGTLSGGSPNGSLLQATTGKLYGLTFNGGANSAGTLFSYDYKTSTFSSKFSFDGAAHGSAPNGSLVEGANGKLYGMTSTGGANNDGVVFEYDTAANTLSKKVDFLKATDGSSSEGSFIRIQNNRLYGMSTFGGSTGDGSFLEFDPASGNVREDFFFNGASQGQHPYGDLLFLCNPAVLGSPSTPSAMSVCAGQPATFNASGSGTRISYQWYKNGIIIPGANTPSYTNPGVSSGDAGPYTCIISNGCSSVTSATITLTVFPLPAVTFTRPSSLDTLCSNGTTTALSGGSPAGGSYSGTGVSGGNIDPSVPPTGNTAVTYSYTDGNGCINTASTQIYIKNCTVTGIADLHSAETFNLYPNPSNGSLELRAITEQSRIEIYDASGKIVYHSQVNAGTTNLDLHSLSNGIYLMRVTGETGASALRFVINK